MRKKIQWASVLAMTCAAGGVQAEETEYRLTFEGRWFASSSNTSGVARPGGAHFSPLIGATHGAGGSFLEVGSAASTGVENVAETGNTAALVGEINAAIGAGTADTLIHRAGTTSTAEETFVIDSFTVDSSQAFLTLITMIAPSPDWFVGVHDLNLLDGNGQFRNEIVIDLANYDAGTEDGTGFSINNSASSPLGVIAALDAAEPNGALRGSGSIARLTLTQVPEPGSLALLAGAGLFLVRRRR